VQENGGQTPIFLPLPSAVAVGGLGCAVRRGVHAPLAPSWSSPKHATRHYGLTRCADARAPALRVGRGQRQLPLGTTLRQEGDTFGTRGCGIEHIPFSSLLLRAANVFRVGARLHKVRVWTDASSCMSAARRHPPACEYRVRLTSIFLCYGPIDDVESRNLPKITIVARDDRGAPT
jgi:hypothetical protein